MLILKLICFIFNYMGICIFDEIFYIGYRHGKNGGVILVNAEINPEAKRYF